MRSEWRRRRGTGRRASLVQPPLALAGVSPGPPLGPHVEVVPAVRGPKVVRHGVAPAPSGKAPPLGPRRGVRGSRGAGDGPDSEERRPARTSRRGGRPDGRGTRG